MGFGNKWVSWIKTCLLSARSSVLVNGSPTKELAIQCGLHQGDPMAPLLFIIAMEGLHIAIDNLVRNGLFSSAKINQVSISHLFYANDVIVVGEWSESNLVNISNALRFFFYGISGLKINFQKSSIIGIGVANEEVNRLASTTCCKAEKLPLNIWASRWVEAPSGSLSRNRSLINSEHVFRVGRQIFFPLAVELL
uniref:uncharacterized protein LOC122587914 n=1 Tax=Erigeron canadensis TaxID=72917 RepID=UPI001CB95D76|nr:uncharacterized protein LOC122587914 [Erigeron canadensis]